MEFSLNKVAVGDILTLRCGAVLTVREIALKDDGDSYPIKLQFEGATLQQGLAFDDEGNNGEGSGPQPDTGYPLDIIKLERQPMIMEAS